MFNLLLSDASRSFEDGFSFTHRCVDNYSTMRLRIYSSSYLFFNHLETRLSNTSLISSEVSKTAFFKAM
jgi:hypothetical protein